MGRRIGIFGGTFDPPHLGHALIAETAFHGLSLDEVWWVPNRRPPHKEKKSETTDEERLSMVSLLCSMRPYFRMSTIEFEREGPSYTVETLEHFRSKYPDCRFYFIIGGDSIETLGDWHEIDRILELVSFAGVSRPGYKSRPDREYPVELLEGPVFDVSSTQIRNMIKEKRLNSFLLPDPVISYIKEHGLYE
ncbi:nicotinate-nucleotide adenylyltransferase [Alteribacter natronophilus]|uniref:nicotinate-nucleotide adenylyltransferase n=1 Tax=Alteribacter natronophilus TaxID=2583810 RepID=UPI00110D45FA|nr:nicotinate-nucleotide adenylyltransferase [Alteribacter natronophilus]TMW73885.1 nicotinate-nucleotide adenylyltransferase [Alteribacter natronophilus]